MRGIREGGVFFILLLIEQILLKFRDYRAADPARGKRYVREKWKKIIKVHLPAFRRAKSCVNY